MRNRRLLLTVLSLLAPELMVLWACKQWLGSLAIKNQINGFVTKNDRIQSDPNRKGVVLARSLIIYRDLMVTVVKKWTKVHAHFLQMGGFKVVFTENEKKDFINELAYQHEDGHLECVVRSDTFQKLLQGGHIDLPDITEDEINDKRKVDNVSKSLALLQLFWFIAQILARAIQHLAITELEITTSALATMNFVMYYFWWHKPLNAQCPVLIHSIEALNNRNTSEVKSREDLKKGCDTPIVKKKPGDPKRNGFFLQLSRRMSDYASRLWRAVYFAFHSFHLPFGLSKMHLPWLAPLFVALASVVFATANVALLIITISLVVALPLDEIHRSSEIVRNDHTQTSKLFNWLLKVPGLSHMKETIHYVTKVNRSLFYSEHATWSSRLFGFVAVLASTVFGAIHCLAWHFDFPTVTEEKLWRMASLVMIGVNIYVAVGVSALIKLRDCITRCLRSLAPNTFSHSPSFIADEDALIFLSIVFSSIIHAIARIMLIVLAIMSLRDLPSSAFEAIGWSDLIPHI